MATDEGVLTAVSSSTLLNSAQKGALLDLAKQFFRQNESPAVSSEDPSFESLTEDVPANEVENELPDLRTDAEKEADANAAASKVVKTSTAKK